MDIRYILNKEIADIKEHYSSERPKSRKLYQTASDYIPGGTTRTVLSFEPFPFRVSETTPVALVDVDGFSYVDFCGDHTCGLLGHSCEQLIDAITNQLRKGWSLGSTHKLEIKAAKLICERFPTIKKVRFTNSGTEANLLSISVCLYLSKKKDVLVFKNGLHGSLLNFKMRNNIMKNELNTPFSFVISEFNDTDRLRNIFEENNIGCVIIEPMQGSGGCILAKKDFLSELRILCNEFCAYLIFDEIMTSRLHPNGLQTYFDIVPDITTVGKYLGGGFSFGAFGGKEEIMNNFDGFGEQLMHSGTFNNNIASMSACIEVLSKLYKESDAISLNKKGDFLRESLSNVFIKHNIPINLSGYGSMMHLNSSDNLWIKWIFYSLLINGHYVSPNGLISLSLEIDAKHISSFVNCCETICGDFNKRYKTKIS
ncbi:MAG: aminotransferase class III-fold pyridoxal phosphate-dependent enzyme [Oscillospiraceae bacterium]|jgi:glutamate-1-semialdehyde 2,1-aminomutase|nr:aminotransferase class III-fold pyridoxal phosphate-dependent enzyme [Oscillospiraceae bacterium]